MLIELAWPNVHQVSKNNIPYVDDEFGCEWGDGRGLGVLVHEKRMVKVGYADSAILLWIAEEDTAKHQ